MSVQDERRRKWPCAVAVQRRRGAYGELARFRIKTNVHLVHKVKGCRNVDLSHCTRAERGRGLGWGRGQEKEKEKSKGSMPTKEEVGSGLVRCFDVCVCVCVEGGQSKGSSSAAPGGLSSRLLLALPKRRNFFFSEA